MMWLCLTQSKLLYPSKQLSLYGRFKTRRASGRQSVFIACCGNGLKGPLGNISHNQNGPCSPIKPYVTCKCSRARMEILITDLDITFQLKLSKSNFINPSLVCNPAALEQDGVIILELCVKLIICLYFTRKIKKTWQI